MENYKMVAKTMFGFEGVLAKELRKLGALNIEEGVRSVSFEGDMGFMYKANLCLRTAIKIIKPIHSFTVRNEEELYKKIYAFDWTEYLTPHTTFAIDTTVNSENFTHSLYVSQKVKDAIVDKFRDLDGIRPDVDIKFPDLRINIHIQKEHCNVSLDTSGRSLHQRGYKTATNIAPINEVLAAGLLLLSGWDGQSDFLDPMCGSGTILVEAAMIACNIPVNINRKEFAFEKWPDYDQELFDKIVESCLNKTREFHFKIAGYDKAPSAIRKAQDNIENANLSEYIKVGQFNFFETEKAVDSHLHILFNPPYGERLDIDMEDFYKNIGDTLKNHYAGTDAWLITSNLEALKFVGLRPSRKIKVFNSHLESRLVKYVMYEGSKKAKFQNKES
ncbi:MULTISPECIES: THUMP domain-containing class I SAM-dependent RNA methyltransferase [Cellulophaga]|uniref:DNA methylase n=2 Tax=Cellulophaga baltica TaxID=76594 RepID=A0AAU8RHH0_9FLAO|nr:MULTISPECIES: THUMP domain-containing protein [Cellulophaga]WFO17656.1 THUMP domain-containing protein [Cellulophaga baltica 4]AIZ41923.1 DNA methylase [Cellulophaga baltica 18]KGK30751.1 DNA methylase [Cellulophaga sp. E6(2014)]MBA6315120.1 class I SAM-dependent RNA methyltransferase [Cellulophaga baltica]MCR1026868.1 THUMP domain-containing protein [Cellulophaga baltica]